MSRILCNKSVFVLLVVFLLAVSIGGAFVLCSMSPMEHLSEWQQAFSAIVSILFVLVAFRYFLQDFFFPTQARVPVSRRGDTGRIFAPLRLAFARGILHTKAY